MISTSALVVTNRPQFIPWWTRQIVKQTRRPDEIIVVTNAADGAPYFSELCTRLDGIPAVIYHQPPEPWVSLGYLRQKALDLSRGDAIAWFDDDDWYHPRRLELSVIPLETTRYDVGVFPLTHFYYVHDDLLLPFEKGLGFHLPSTAWRSHIAKRVHFFHLGTAEDTHWINRLVHCAWAPPHIPASRVFWDTAYFLPHIGGIVVVHGHNTWQNPSSRGDFGDACSFYASEGRRLPKSPPLGEKVEDWNFVREQVSSLRLLPVSTRERKPFRLSTRETWERAHRSSLLE